MSTTTRRIILAVFACLTLASAYYVTKLGFAFSLDQFFPKGDPDLAFFEEFVQNFETDVNFLLIAIERKDGVFEQEFLEQVHDFSLSARDLPYVEESQALTQLSYPLKTPFGITAFPVIHIDEPERYEKDKARILADERFVHQFINEDATALVVMLRTLGSSNGMMALDESATLLDSVEHLIAEYEFEDWHALGPPFFQREMVRMQKREVVVSAAISGLLVTLVMFFIFRKPLGIALALASIGMGLLFFMGFLGATGRDLNAMAALYPVLMIIVGTSDVIHIMSKYIDELKKGLTKNEAIRITIREIGLATLLTSITTAVGFATLVTSRIGPIRDFGINAAIGVIIAYITVIFFTTSILSLLDREQLMKSNGGAGFWDKWMDKSYAYTLRNGRNIMMGLGAVLILCAWGISMINTNYQIKKNLPRGAKITSDFEFFEKSFSGFRPLEIAVFAQGDNEVEDFKVMKEIAKVQAYVSLQPGIRGAFSHTDIYKSINQMYNRNKAEYYTFPEEESIFKKYQRLAEKVPKIQTSALVSEDGKKARITSRMLDIGADSIKAVGAGIDQWIAENTDPATATFKRTGTGLILDKNAEYVRDSLLKGLGLAVVIVSLLMALLFQNWRMVLISLIPNTIPLLLAGAMLGFLGIELEAGISIVFAVVFGIAVDDTIHFLSKYKLARNKGLDIEESLQITFQETGKAICLTSVILFFGFLVMLFSIHPPSIIVGVLISMTLISALVSDLLLIPVFIRWWIKKEGIWKRKKAVNLNSVTT